MEYKVGEYVILETAGGWNYYPDNNGCLGVITLVSSPRTTYTDSILNHTCCITGKILNSNRSDTDFKNIPVGIFNGKNIVRKATQDEIGSYISSKSDPKTSNRSFDNCKIWIGNDPKLCKQVQEKLFELGYKWYRSCEDGKTASYLDSYALYTNQGTLGRTANNRSFFNNSIDKEITPKDLGIELETSKPLYNINTVIQSLSKPDYDLSTTITRAVKANDPSIIYEEFGVSEVTNLATAGCRLTGSNITKIYTKSMCIGLKCDRDNCPFSYLKSSEYTYNWLRQSLSIETTKPVSLLEFPIVKLINVP